MMETETTRETTLRQALRIIRNDLAGETYLPGGGPRCYECDRGTLWVNNADNLLGVFEARLIDHRGNKVRTYKI